MKTTELFASLGAAAAVAVLNVREMASLSMEITGTFVGTISFEYTIDGVTWHAMNDPVATATTATAVGKNFFNVALFKEVRMRMSAYTSGTAKLALYANEEYCGLGSSV